MVRIKITFLKKPMNFLINQNNTLKICFKEYENQNNKIKILKIVNVFLEYKKIFKQKKNN